MSVKYKRNLWTIYATLIALKESLICTPHINPTILRYLFKVIKELSIDVNWGATEYNTPTYCKLISRCQI